jgi:hypothetical protein
VSRECVRPSGRGSFQREKINRTVARQSTPRPTDARRTSIRPNTARPRSLAALTGERLAGVSVCSPTAPRTGRGPARLCTLSLAALASRDVRGSGSQHAAWLAALSPTHLRSRLSSLGLPSGPRLRSCGVVDGKLETAKKINTPLRWPHTLSLTTTAPTARVMARAAFPLSVPPAVTSSSFLVFLPWFLSSVSISSSPLACSSHCRFFERSCSQCQLRTRQFVACAICAPPGVPPSSASSDLHLVVWTYALAATSASAAHVEHVAEHSRAMHCTSRTCDARQRDAHQLCEEAIGMLDARISTPCTATVSTLVALACAAVGCVPACAVACACACAASCA